jgi:hypothetical protein
MPHYPFLLGNVRGHGPLRSQLTRVGRLFTLLVLLLALVGGPTSPVRAATSITFTADELLGRPTDTSIAINIVPDSTIAYHYQYGTVPGVYTGQTSNATATGGQPHNVVISGLTVNTHLLPDALPSAGGDRLGSTA